MNIQKITTIEECRNVLTNEIKTFPDWPQKGVNFKDIQSILMNPELAEITSFYLKEFHSHNQMDSCDQHPNQSNSVNSS